MNKHKYLFIFSYSICYASHCEMPIGTGMSALAPMLNDLGHKVCGSDVEDNYFTEDGLTKKNIKIIPFNTILSKDYIYIISSAYDEENNQDVQFVKNNQFEYYYYYDFLGKMKDLDKVCISGTHGKTSTAHILSLMLGDACSSVVGDGEGRGCKNTKVLVLEACEYKEHFLSYSPSVLVINNIELDHPDYYKSIV